MKKKLIECFLIPITLLCSCGNNNVPYNGVKLGKYENEVTEDIFNEKEDQKIETNIFSRNKNKQEVSFNAYIECGSKKEIVYKHSNKVTSNVKFSSFGKCNFNVDNNNKTANLTYLAEIEETSNYSDSSSYDHKYDEQEMSYQYMKLENDENEKFYEINKTNKTYSDMSKSISKSSSFFSFFVEEVANSVESLADDLSIDTGSNEDDNMKYYVDNNYLTMIASLDKTDDSKTNQTVRTNYLSIIQYIIENDYTYEIKLSFTKTTTRTYLVDSSDKSYKQGDIVETKYDSYFYVKEEKSDVNVEKTSIDGYRED